MELETDARAMVTDALARGVLINAATDRVLRFVPPLVITQQEVDKLIDLLDILFNRRPTAGKDSHH
jgi:acetylornithine aminotransferase